MVHNRKDNAVSSFSEGSFIFAGFDFDLPKCINSKAHEDPLSVGIEPALD